MLKRAYVRRVAILAIACGAIVAGLVLFVPYRAVLADDPAPGDPIDPIPVAPKFVFGMGVHTITGYSLLDAQETLKISLDCGGDTDPDDMLVFECTVETGRVMLWWLDLEPVTVTDIFTGYDVADTVDPNGHDIALQVLSVGLEHGGYSTQAYLMVLRDDTLQVGVALPLTAETWNSFLSDVGVDPLPANTPTCAEKAVDWCNDWYPPCGTGSGIGGIIGCAEAAACRNATCHNLACITNAYDCCENGHERTYCWWQQWATGGHNLEHVTCDTVYALELTLCLPVHLIKEIFM